MREALDKLIESVVADRLNWYGWLAHEAALPYDLWEVARAAYHDSLDAAKALHEALLPGWTWGRAPQGNVWVRRHGGPFVWGGDKPPDNPARAWLIAILRAYRAQMQDAP